MRHDKLVYHALALFALFTIYYTVVKEQPAYFDPTLRQRRFNRKKLYYQYGGPERI